MFWRRKNLVERVDELINVVKFASMKFRIAYNLVSNRKEYRRILLTTTIPTAMAGFPLLPQNLSKLYLDSVVRDIRKCIKSLRKLDGLVREKYPGTYVAYFQVRLKHLEEVLNNVLWILEDTALSQGDITEIEGSLSEALSELIELRDYMTTNRIT